jgi:hypothetical protein
VAPFPITDNLIPAPVGYFLPDISVPELPANIVLIAGAAFCFPIRIRREITVQRNAGV